MPMTTRPRQKATILIAKAEALDAKRSDRSITPIHYTAHPSGIECIQIVEHMSFNLGNAVKYVWRSDLKGDSINDLKKAVWYINREVFLRSGIKTT